MLKKQKKSSAIAENRDHEAGFTLLQAAIGLMVLGIIGTGMMQGYQVSQLASSTQQSESKIATIENAINQFYTNENARYPCPASLNAAESDAKYGKEADCSLANFANIKECTDASWKTTDGYCKTDATAHAVVIGAVPFDVLKINYEDSLDYWSNKILYAVTYQKTVQSNFDAHMGAVKIITKDNEADTKQDQIPDEKIFADQPDFILVSLGVNGRGGFTKDGLELTACGDATTGYESENCNYDNTFFAAVDSEVPNTGAYSRADGLTYYDDFTGYQTKVSGSVWFPSPKSPQHVITLSEKVGIGMPNPQYSLQVQGNIKAPAEVRSKAFCDNKMTNCFDPELITGKRPEMNCPSVTPITGLGGGTQQGVIRLGKNRFFCSGSDSQEGIQLDTAKFKPKNCHDTGQLVTGFDASGNPICGDI